MTPGEWFRACREATGLSQRQFAAKRGIAAGTLGQLERDYFVPNLAVVPHFATAFGVSPMEMASLWLAPDMAPLPTQGLTAELEGKR